MDTYKHRIDVYADINVSQTFDEQSYSTKTLHNLLSLHEDAVIIKANPANFSFTTPIFNYSSISYPIIFELGTKVLSSGNLDYFDLYLETDTELFKLDTCVIESLVFNINHNDILTMSVSGTAKQLSRGHSSVPGTLVSDTQDYSALRNINIELNSTTAESITATNIEFVNSVNWVDYRTLHDAVDGNISYPDNFVLAERRISGSFTQHLTSDNVTTFADNAVGQPLVINVYSEDSQSPSLLEFNLPSIVYTRRLGLGEVYTRVYDFRLNYNTTIIQPIYKGV